MLPETLRRHQMSLIELLRKHTYNEERLMIGAEVGVWRGHTSHILLKEFPSLYLCLIDSYDEKHFFKSFQVESMSEAFMEAIDNVRHFALRCRFVRKDSLEAASMYPDGFFSFVFLDASHYYEDVKADLSVWPAKVKSGGLVCGHDYNGRGDNMRRKPFGVKRAVDEHMATVNADLILKRGHVWAYIQP